MSNNLKFAKAMDEILEQYTQMSPSEFAAYFEDHEIGPVGLTLMGMDSDFSELMPLFYPEEFLRASDTPSPLVVSFEPSHYSDELLWNPAAAA
jgi:hypothetical protein